MGETVGSGKVVAKDFNNNKIVTYNIAIYDASSSTPATPTQVANWILAIKAAAALQNLGIEIEQVNSVLV